MIFKLLTTRRFLPLFVVQFLSALNDNFVKTALVMLVLYRLNQGDNQLTIALATGLLVAPMFFLSALGGELADKIDKSLIVRWLKLAELPVAGLAALGFALQSPAILLAAMFGFGIIAALFGPIKYGILPDHLEIRELPAANALVEAATFAAILIGTIAGGLSGGSGIMTSLTLPLIMAFALGSLACAYLIPRVTPAAPQLKIDPNPLRSTFRVLAELRADRPSFIGGLIISWFWLVGTVVLTVLPVLIKSHLGGSEETATAALTLFTLGIAAGSLLAARLSRMRPNLALVPVGAVLMALALFDLTLEALKPAIVQGTPFGLAQMFGSLKGARLSLDLFGLSFAGGLYVVPAFAAVQAGAAADHRARIIAGINVLNALFMSLGAVGVIAIGALELGIAAALGLIAAGSLLTAILVVRAWGRQGLQDVAAFIFKMAYGLEVYGLQNLPSRGTRAIITPNHVSFMDGPVMHAILPSYASFAVDTGIAEAWWVKPFLKLISAHTMDPTKPFATRDLINVVKGGETLVIFPEGRLTVTGQLMKVYEGAGLIADKADAVVVPVRIDGLERTPWSYLRRTQLKKRWFPKVVVTILPPVRLSIDPSVKGRLRRQAAGRALQDAMIDAAVRTTPIDRTVFEALLDAKTNRDTGAIILEDPLRTKLTFKKLLLGARILSGKLAPLAKKGEALGVLLPNTAGVVVTFFALQRIGRVPAMLNYTAGPKNLIAACTAAKVATVLTSRAFIEKAKLGEVERRLTEAGIKLVMLEDVRASIGTLDKVKGLLSGDRHVCDRKPGDPAVILFTSGSEGLPKGVVLSHRNILANCAQSLARVDANCEDKVFNALPVFHSFGLTAGLVMPLTDGIPVYLYPSPLHYRIVPELIYQTNSTIVFGTDTFLFGYGRSAHPYDFRSVRFILAGAEPVKQRTRDLFIDKFGVRILEGYGVTETAPVLAINVPMANRPGSVGRLQPMMETKVEPVFGIEEGGRLHVRGPNVMLGYLKADNPGVIQPPEHGWYDTGDIVAIDKEGFIAIKGRAKRFAKVGGEMISLAAVEALAADVWPSSIPVVVAVPDARKGERLILLSKDKSATRDMLIKAAKAHGQSELMVPSEIMLVDQIPLLGSGKPDFMAANKLVSDRLAGASVVRPAAE